MRKNYEHCQQFVLCCRHSLALLKSENLKMRAMLITVHAAVRDTASIEALLQTSNWLFRFPFTAFQKPPFWTLF